MKRFLVKFCLLFILIDGIVGIYALYIRPQLTGDMGHLGQIAFGKEYVMSLDSIYHHSCLLVHDIGVQDTLSLSTILTIGDSFSRQGIKGYSQFLGEYLHCNVQNVLNYAPEQTFVQFVLDGKIPPETIVIVESVERSMISRLNSIVFTDTILPVYEPSSKEDIFADTRSFFKKAMGLKQPIKQYPIDRELFTHKTRKGRLYIYDSPWDYDGDLRFTSCITEESIKMAYQKLYMMYNFANSHNIHLLYLIAADKYDVYEPFITTAHETNPTLNYIPMEEWIINSKPFLQDAAFSGVKDIYYINDTHWSPVGAKIVGEEVARRINEIEIIR